MCRLEYLKGEAPAVFVPALLTTSSFQALLAPAVLEAIAVFAVMYLAGFIVNALADRDLDVKYDSFKREIGEATAKLGARRVRLILGLHLAAALVLALHLAITLRAPELFALAAVGTFLAMAYSLPPLHLKVRGIAAHAVSLSLSAFAIPFLFLYRVAAGQVDALGFGICAAFTLTHYGLTYTNQAYDFDLDIREGVKTPPVRIGLRRSLVVSGIMTGAGLVALSFGLVMLALSRPAVAAAWGPLGATAIAVGTPALLFVGYGIPLRGIARMLKAVQAAPTEVDAVPVMRTAVNYANFHAAGIAALAVFGLLFFAANVQAGALLEGQAAESLTFEGLPSPGPNQSGPSWDIEFAVHNGGARPLPAGSVVLLVKFPSGGGQGDRAIPLDRPIPAGATVTGSFVEPRAYALAPGSEVVFVLAVDANRDGLDYREVDRRAWIAD